VIQESTGLASRDGPSSLHTVAGAATLALCALFGPEGRRRHGRIPDSIRPLLDKAFRDVPERVAERGVRARCNRISIR
jgi:hypothetical protein